MDLFSLNRLTAYDDGGNVVATVHYSLKYTGEVHPTSRLLSAEKYDDLLQSCKKEAAVASVEKDKYKIFGRMRRMGGGRRNNFARGRRSANIAPPPPREPFWRPLMTNIVSSAVQGAVMAGPSYLELFASTEAPYGR
ncbi:hypothetical protein Y032_0008g138 [Ancylostoma ceylanicum]|nr:hypothetical protein Y032_0008g138 [Ancylostoma ceylanicum]